jgi:hypothetical protein
MGERRKNTYSGGNAVDHDAIQTVIDPSRPVFPDGSLKHKLQQLRQEENITAVSDAVEPRTATPKKTPSHARSKHPNLSRPDRRPQVETNAVTNDVFTGSTEQIVGTLTTFDALLVALARSGVKRFPLDSTVWNDALYAMKQRDSQNPEKHQMLKDFEVDMRESGKMKSDTITKVIGRISQEFGDYIVTENHRRYLQLDDERIARINTEEGWLMGSFTVEVGNLSLVANSVFGEKKPY